MPLLEEIKHYPPKNIASNPGIRYRGGDFAISLSDLPQQDQSTLKNLYNLLATLLESLLQAKKDIETHKELITKSLTAEIISKVYGLPDIESSTQGYIGAVLHDHYFVSWFHWPVAGES